MRENKMKIQNVQYFLNNLAHKCKVLDSIIPIISLRTFYQAFIVILMVSQTVLTFSQLEVCKIISVELMPRMASLVGTVFSRLSRTYDLSVNRF